MERVAFLIEQENQRISCMLNPETVLIRRSAGIKTRTSIGGALTGYNLADDPLLFTGGGSTWIELELLFDVTLPGSTVQTKDVRRLTEPFFSMAENRPDKEQYNKLPLVRLIWGKTWNVPGVVTDVAERLDYFTPEGIPRRSWLKMRMRRIWEPPEEEDTEKGMEKGMKNLLFSPDVLEKLDQSRTDLYQEEISELHKNAETVVTAERLDNLAYRFWGDPSLWKLIALYNGIEDPFATSGAQAIKIPPLTELVKLV